MSINPEGKSCSDLSRVLVLNDPAAGEFLGRDETGQEVVRTGAMVDVTTNVRDTFPARTPHPDDAAAAAERARGER